MDATPFVLVAVLSFLLVGGTSFFCYKRRARRDRDRRRMRVEKVVTSQEPRYQVPYFSSASLEGLPSHQPSKIQSSKHNNGNNQSNYPSTLQALPHAHAARSNSSLHILEVARQSRHTDDDDDFDESLHIRSNAVLLDISSSQRQQLEQNRNRSPSPRNLGSSPYLELSPLRPVHQKASSSSLRKYQDYQQGDINIFLSKSGSTVSQREIQPPPPTQGGSLRKAGSYLPSPLPRPLHRQWPVIADASITSSTNIVASITKSAGTNLDHDNTPVSEPNLFTILKSPALLALATSTRFTSKASSQLRETPARAATTVATTVASRHQRAQRQQQQQQQLSQVPASTPVKDSRSRESTGSTGDPFLSKEELERKAPQGLIPENYEQPVFTAPISDVPNPTASTAATTDRMEATTSDVTSDVESNELNMAFLVLEPYLKTTDHELPAKTESIIESTPSPAGTPVLAFRPSPTPPSPTPPSPTPPSPVPVRPRTPILRTPSPAPVPFQAPENAALTHSTLNTSSPPPARPARRNYCVAGQDAKSPQLQHQAPSTIAAPSEPSIEPPRASTPVEEPLAQPISASASETCQPTTSAIAAFPLPPKLSARSPSPAPPLPATTSSPTSDTVPSRVSSAATIRPTYPSASASSQARGARAGTFGWDPASPRSVSSDDDRERNRAISPVPSYSSSGHSFNISSVLSIIPNTLSTANTSLVSLGDSPGMSPIMDQASPTSAKMYSPTTPSSARTAGAGSGYGSGPASARTPISPPDRYHDDFLVRNRDDHQGRTKGSEGNEDAQTTSQKLLAEWLRDPPPPGSSPGKKRVNEPHVGNFGTQFSQFSFDDRESRGE